jgi:hypothetical protein
VEKYGQILERIELYSLLSTADKTFGPYQRSDGRSIIIVIDDKGNRKTTSFPKWVLEQHLGRKLDPDTETVDHWNSDINDNRIENLRIVPRDQHSADDTRRVKLIKLKCEVCKKDFERSPRLIRDKSKKGKVSAFCSRECAGKYSREVQLGKRDKLPVQDAPTSEYYKRKYVDASIDYLLEKYAALVDC